MRSIFWKNIMKIIRRKRKKLFRIKKRGRIRRGVAKRLVVGTFYRRYLYQRMPSDARTRKGYFVSRSKSFFRIKRFLRVKGVIRMTSRVKRSIKFGALFRKPSPFFELRRFKHIWAGVTRRKNLLFSVQGKNYKFYIRRGNRVKLKRDSVGSALLRLQGLYRKRGQVRRVYRKELGHIRRLRVRILLLKKRVRTSRFFFNKSQRYLVRTYWGRRLRAAPKVHILKKPRRVVSVKSLRLKFIRAQSPYRLVEKRDVFSGNHFIWRFNNLLMRHGARHHSTSAIVHAYYYAKHQAGLNFFADWLDMQERLRFPFLLKSYYYRGARGVRLVKYVLAKERVDRQYLRSLRFLRTGIFRNQNTAFWLKLVDEYESLVLGERSSLLTGLEQLTLQAIEARGDRLDDKYHRALEQLESSPELHFRW
jgi:hypothetical protein